MLALFFDVRGNPMDAVERTKTLKRMNVPINDLIPNENNPNVMDEKSFNLLYDNMEKVGITDPILVRTHPTMKGKYKIMGGHHRWEAAKLLDFIEVPVTIVTDDSIDEDQEKFQLMRHNMIRGKLSPQKFVKLYESLSQKYAEDVAAELFGFAEQEEFRKLIAVTAKSLPPEMQGEFKKAAAEIQTIDGLALLLNRLFSTYGDTLPYGYMFLDFGGKDSVWLRMKSKDRDHFIEFAAICKDKSVTVDSAMSGLLQLIAQNSDIMGELFQKMAGKLIKVEIPNGVDIPTEDNIETNDYAKDL